MDNNLKNVVAVVTGASRGAGRGIACALGERGATVVVTGRSRAQGTRTEGLPGTIDETAAEVTRRGGHGIAIPCDHTNDADIERLVADIEQRAGHIDLLVNNAWGGYEAYSGSSFTAPFWEQPISRWDAMFTAGLRSHLMTSRAAVRLMLPRQRGMILATTAWDRDLYLGNLFYDIAKHAVNRMVFGMARELASHSIGALSIAPGFMRTERVMAEHDRQPFDISRTESPEFVGRVIAALAGDADAIRFSGRTMFAADLAAEYGVTDIDGRIVPPFHIDA